MGAASAALSVLLSRLLFTHYYVDNPFGIVGVIGGKVTTYGSLEHHVISVVPCY